MQAFCFASGSGLWSISSHFVFHWRKMSSVLLSLVAVLLSQQPLSKDYCRYWVVLVPWQCCLTLRVYLFSEIYLLLLSVCVCVFVCACMRVHTHIISALVEFQGQFCGVSLLLFYVLWGLNLAHLVCEAVTLSTEPSCQPWSCSIGLLGCTCHSQHCCDVLRSTVCLKRRLVMSQSVFSTSGWFWQFLVSSLSTCILKSGCQHS